tara:strand:- start:668 stop:1156 length:489 start_codon:yes stop_codon:yes gene_type:complete
MKKFICLLLIFFTTSCSKIEFVYKDNKNLINPLYKKTEVIMSGVDITYINSYIPMFFGKNEKDTFNLFINIEENKTKRAIETNQAASNVRYELRFNYILTSKTKNCSIFEKEILSYFSIIPKSDGYNYGADASLENKYELTVTENLSRFMSFISDIDINNCK